MQMTAQEHEFETLLARERARLVRLCAWLTGDAEAAEDLAQETLLAAWKNRARLESPDHLSAWLTGIARNVCLAWSRRRSREQAHRAAPAPMDNQAHAADGPGAPREDALENTPAAGDSLEIELDRAELAGLLDQALALLPADTARLLVAHYIEESPHAQIAEALGLSAPAVAVRLQRGRLALRRVLSTRLQSESAGLGLVEPDRAWEQTNIWCPSCGEARLLGQFRREGPDARFALRCPRCTPDPDAILAGLDLTNAYNASLLAEVKSFKPAYNRLITLTTGLYQQALEQGGARCPSCGKPAQVVVVHSKVDQRTGESSSDSISDIRILCHACGWASNKTRSALMMGLPEAQRFWRDNPRMRTLPAQEVETQGALAVVTRMQSVTGAAGLAVVSTRDTFTVLGVHPHA